MTDEMSRPSLLANLGHLSLHAVAVAVFFVSTTGFFFQDSPKFSAVPWYWEAMGWTFFGASLIGIPILAIGSVLFMMKGRIKPARYMCWLSLLLAVMMFVSVVSIYGSAG